MITTTNADGVLKSYYLDVVSEQLDKTANPFLAAIEKTTADVWGKDVRKPVRFGMSGGVGAGAEDGTLPVSGDTNFATFVAPLKNLYGTVEISDKALRVSAGSEGAFVNLLNDEMNALVRSSSYNLGRMLFGDGSGKLATVTASSGTVDTVRYLAEGMIVDVYSSADTLKQAAAAIKTVDRAAKKITFTGSVTLAADDYLVMQNSKDRELTGLKAIFATEGTLYGIDRTDNTWLKPFSKDLSEEAITETVLQTALDSVEEQSGGKTDFIICSWGVRRALVNALAGRHDVPSQHEGLRAPSALRLAVARGRRRQDPQTDPRQGGVHGDPRQICRTPLLPSLRSGRHHGDQGRITGERRG